MGTWLISTGLSVEGGNIVSCLGVGTDPDTDCDSP